MELKLLNEKVLTESGLLVLVDELKKYINTASDVVKQYASLYEFPNVGSEKVIYIDKSTNQTYRWDDDDIKYYCVGTDYNNIDIISGGDSK